jgi:hypothetical protein
MKVDSNRSFEQIYLAVKQTLSDLQIKISAIWQKICAYSIFSTKPLSVYCFSQQTNADCHLRMWDNFHRLQAVRARDKESGKAIFQQGDFLAHRDWLGKGHSDFSNWLAAKNTLIMQQYLTKALNEAPLYPELQDSLGHNYFTSPFNPFEQAERRSLSPTFLKKMTAQEQVYTLPLYEQNGQYFCFDSDIQSYTPVRYLGYGNLQPQNFIFSGGQAKSLPANFATFTLVKQSGSRSFIKAIDPDLAVAGRYVPRELGTYKLLLLNLGLDANNTPLDSAHPDAAVAANLQNEMRVTNTSWNPDRCKKEHLIEYALAKLFKENPMLFEKVKQHVDFYFKSWSRYDNDLPKLFNKNKVAFKDKDLSRYLPGKEQMLAYCLMKNVQYLWVASISSDAFCHHMGMPSFVNYIPGILGPSHFTKAAYVKQDGISFIDLWKEIQAQLRVKAPQQQDWVSFSGHGMVFSFDADLQQQQNQRSISNRTLAQDLGLAGIDSLHGKVMNVFYKTNKTLETVQNL